MPCSDESERMKIMKNRWWIVSTMILALLLVFGPVRVLPAQKTDEDPAETTELPGEPIVVVNIASIDRVMEDIDYLFGTVERKDMIDVIDGLLEDIGNLEGIPRDKPFGMMLFLKAGLAPRPAATIYLPVDDAAAIIESLSIVGVAVKETSEGHYKLDGDGVTGELQFVRLVDGYAFWTESELEMERDFPDPAEAFESLTTRYTAAVELRPKSIPPGMRKLFLNIVRSRTQGELQQRDDEPDMAYAIRKARGLRNLHALEVILTQTESLTFGLDVSKKSEQAVFELVIEAEAESAFLESLHELAEKPSRFAPVDEGNAAIDLAVNAMINQETAEVYTQLFKESEAALARALTRMQRGLEEADGEGEVVVTADPITEALAKRLFEPLLELLESRNIDGFTQYLKTEAGQYYLIGALEVPGATRMETPLREIVNRIRSAQPKAAELWRVEYDVATFGNVSLHRLVPAKIGEDAKRNFGEDFAIYVGFGPNAVWFGFGGAPVSEALEQAITRVTDASLAEKRRDEAPIRLTVNAKRLLGMSESEGDLIMLREAFSEDNDSLRINFRPTKTGGRVRFELEKGFIRLLGLAISQEYDENQL